MQNRLITLFITLAAVVLAGPIGCGKSSNSASSNSRAGAAQGYFKTPWQDECQFIVQSVVTDIAEMAFFAKHNSLPKADQFSVSVEEKPGTGIDAPTYSIQISVDKAVPAIKRDLAVTGPIWSPEVYTDFAKAIFDAVEISAADAIKPGP